MELLRTSGTVQVKKIYYKGVDFMEQINPEDYWFDKVGTIRHLLDAIESLQKAQANTVGKYDQRCLTM